MTDIEYVAIDDLKPHEALKEKKFQGFTRFARSKQKTLRIKPILIDRDTKVILDGHHRLAVLKKMGCLKVPCIAVDYLNDDSITVVPRRPDVVVSKKAVLEMGISKGTFPAKTTKHVFLQEPEEIWLDIKKCY